MCGSFPASATWGGIVEAWEISVRGRPLLAAISLELEYGARQAQTHRDAARGRPGGCHSFKCVKTGNSGAFVLVSGGREMSVSAELTASPARSRVEVRQALLGRRSSLWRFDYI